jgi:hypothetical protein
MSTIVNIADVLTAALNAHAFGQAFTAVRRYRPVYELAEMADLHVTVVPKGVALERADRSREQVDVRIDVAVQKKVADDNEIDSLMALVEEIAAFARDLRLEECAAVWLRTENEPVYAPEHLAELWVFTSVLTLTFRVVR